MTDRNSEGPVRNEQQCHILYAAQMFSSCHISQWLLDAEQIGVVISGSSGYFSLCYFCISPLNKHRLRKGPVCFSIGANVT